MRFQKHKINTLASAERHHKDREKLKNREHPEREMLNYSWAKNKRTLLQNCKEAKTEQEKRTGRKIRKDANICIEFVMTFSPYEDEKRKIETDLESRIYFDEELRKAWIKKNLEFIAEKFGKQNILKIAAEADEQTFHIHIFVLPADEKGNINFKAYVQNKHDIEKMQDEYAEKMSVFGLERGKKKALTGAKHKPLSKYYKEQEQAAEKNAERIIDEARKTGQEMNAKIQKHYEEITESIFADKKTEKKENISINAADEILR